MRRITRKICAAVFVAMLLSAATVPGLLSTNSGPDPGGDPAVEVLASAEAAQNCSPNVESHVLGFFSIAKSTSDYVGCKLSDTGVNTTETDAQQTKIDIYQSTQNQNSNSEVTLTGINNYLQDTESVALMEAKNAYIRSLNNESSKSAAEVDAKEAVSDYYAIKQRNLAESWNTQVENIRYLAGVASNESGINAPPRSSQGSNPFVYSVSTNLDYYQAEWVPGNDNGQINLVNGSSHEVQELHVRNYDYNNNVIEDGTNKSIGPSTGEVELDASFNNPSGTVTEVSAINVTGPDSDYDSVTAIDFSANADLWSEIQTQDDEVRSQVQTFVDNTYDEYQAGEINNTDLVDPYIAEREYSPNGSFQSWATMQLAQYGSGAPDDLDQVGQFEVSTGAGSYEGMLLSDESPASGQFKTGTTYDPSAIGGQQYVVTSSEMLELTDNFTVGNITNANGENIQNVTVEEREYTTANTTEYRNLMNDLEEFRAEVEAREKNQNGDGGGGLIGGTMDPIVLLAVAGGAIYLLTKRGRSGPRY